MSLNKERPNLVVKRKKPSKEAFVDVAKKNIEAIIYQTDDQEELVWLSVMFLNSVRTILRTQYGPAIAKKIMLDKIEELYKIED